MANLKSLVNNCGEEKTEKQIDDFWKNIKSSARKYNAEGNLFMNKTGNNNDEQFHDDEELETVLAITGSSHGNGLGLVREIGLVSSPCASGLIHSPKNNYDPSRFNFKGNRVQPVQVPVTFNNMKNSVPLTSSTTYTHKSSYHSNALKVNSAKQNQTTAITVKKNLISNVHQNEIVNTRPVQKNFKNQNNGKTTPAFTMSHGTNKSCIGNFKLSGSSSTQFFASNESHVLESGKVNHQGRIQSNCTEPVKSSGCSLGPFFATNQSHVHENAKEKLQGKGMKSNCAAPVKSSGYSLSKFFATKESSVSESVKPKQLQGQTFENNCMAPFDDANNSCQVVNTLSSASSSPSTQCQTEKAISKPPENNNSKLGNKENETNLIKKYLEQERLASKNKKNSREPIYLDRQNFSGNSSSPLS